MVRLELHLEMCANDSGGRHGAGFESVKDGHRGSEKLSDLPGVTWSVREESGSKHQLRGCNRDLFQSIPSSPCGVDDIKKHSLQIRKFKEESVTRPFLPRDHGTHWVERLWAGYSDCHLSTVFVGLVKGVREEGESQEEPWESVTEWGRVLLLSPRSRHGF